MHHPANFPPAAQREEHRAIDGNAVTLLASIGVILGLAATAADHFHTTDASWVWKALLFFGLSILAAAVFLLSVMFLPRGLGRDPRTWWRPRRRYVHPITELETRRRRLRQGVGAFALALIFMGIVVTVGVGTGDIKVGGTGGKGGMGGNGGPGGIGGTGGKGGLGGNGGTAGQTVPVHVTVHVVETERERYQSTTPLPMTP